MESPREKYVRELDEQSTHEYRRHLIVKESDGRWLLMQPAESGWDDPKRRWSNNMWTEVIALHGSGLYVGGDIDPVVFGGGPKHPEARVRWMGSRRSGADGYFIEKASIGMGGRDIAVMRWDREVAYQELLELEADVQVRVGTAAGCIVKEARDYLDDGGAESMFQTLHRINALDLEEYEHIGYVPAYRLFWAHGALARLATLLDARENDRD